jgi:hypothetical protein
LVKWTPVVLGKQFPRLPRQRKVNYSTEYLLNSGEVPPHIEELPESPIINLPLVNIQHQLSKLVELSSLGSDDQLCFFLESYLAKLRQGLYSASTSASHLRPCKLKLSKKEEIWNEFRAFMDNVNGLGHSQPLVPISQVQPCPLPINRRREAKKILKQEQIIEQYKADGLKPR